MTKDSKLITVPIRIIPFLSELAMLDKQGLEDLKGQLTWMNAESSERRRKILKEREGSN